MNKFFYSRLTAIKAICISLLVFTIIFSFMPTSSVSAGDLTWTTIPVLDGNSLQVTQNTDATVYAVTPDGETIFAYCDSGFYTDEDDIPHYLIKSSDSGKSWSYQSMDENEQLGSVNEFSIEKIVISPEIDNDDTVAALAYDNTEGYKTVIMSYNSGEYWSELDKIDDFLTNNDYLNLDSRNDIELTDLDINYNSNGNQCVVLGWKDINSSNDVPGGVGLYISRNTDRWVDLSSEDLHWDNSDVIGLAFSPNYQDDETIFAVTNPSPDPVTERDTVCLQSIVVGEYWNDDFKYGILYNQGSTGEAITTATDAYIAFPHDFDVNDLTAFKVLVGLVCTSDYDDIFRIDGNPGVTSVIAKSLEYYDYSIEELSSIAYNGTYANGTLAAADTNGTIWHTTEVSSSSPAWLDADKPPTGINPKLAFSSADGTLFVGTSNYYNDTNSDYYEFGSAFSASTDYNIFYGISLISFEDLAELTMGSIYHASDSDAYFWLTDSDNSIKVLFKSVDNGDSYYTIYNTIMDSLEGILGGRAVWVSPDYVNDNTFYISTTYKYILKTTDGGDNFTASKVYVPDYEIISFFLIDDSNYYVGGEDGIYLNDSKSPVIKSSGLDVPYLIRSIDDDWFVVQEVPYGEIYLSTDEGVSFNMIIDLDGKSLQMIDKTSQTFYATDNANIYKFTVGSSTNWELIGTAVWEDTDGDEVDLNIKTMIIKNNIVYACVILDDYDGDGDEFNDPQAFRLISLPPGTGYGDLYFEAVPLSS